ncbi:paraquat-inducible protein A [Oceanicella sp. SM1341]|uniref:paraquat-inducible protein A n=1 Tax=Oceanicella sp. SM1341 TaxID=1548889 RepID=UPI000E4E0908|nr:paraquat-inducible protein A [Oceanicella sp. SM1341]
MESDLRGLTACHICDALCRDETPAPGQRVRCPRCGTPLRTGHARAIDQLLAISLAVLVLMGTALALPFLGLEGGGLAQEATVLDAAEAIGSGRAWPLGVAVGALIFAVPLTRALALCYVLLPLRHGHPPRPHARAAFRLAIELRPWSMAEIFVIGVAVALVKIAGLATVQLEPAFWIFVLLGVLVTLEDIALCRRSIWTMLG